MGLHSQKQITRLGLRVHPRHEVAEDAIIILNDAALKHGIEIVDLDNAADASTGDICQAIASIGGDGTLLSAVHSAHAADIPVLGINVGDLGYLTTCGVEEIQDAVKRMAAGDYWIESRSMLKADISDGSDDEVQLVALNDIVMHRHVPGGGLMALDVELNGRFLATYEVDGLIISTPTGSTAYNLSAGGSILSPTLKAFIITPICAHSFSARSLVVDDSSVLVINPRLKMPGEVAFVTADGQQVAELRNCRTRSGNDEKKSCRITIRRADSTARLIRFHELVFSDVLRDKLDWAKTTPSNRIK